MLEKLRQHLNINFPYLQNSTVAIAVSGGLDSMVLAHLLLKLEYNISVLHCNFTLRGEDSNQDQQFVSHFSSQHQVPFYSVKFDTKAFADDNKVSIQMAARQLRYRWFSEQAHQRKIDYVLTAHHADDNAETFLINMSRGSGVDGLVGIPALNGNIVRPLLPFSRAELEDYANQHSVQWREDSSNASDNYLRNKIRHHVLPALKNIDSDFLKSMQKSQDYLRQTNTMAEDAAVLVFQKVAQYANDEVHFNLNELMKLPNYKSYLYRWLREYDFTAWEDIYQLTDSQTGKQVVAPKYRLFKNRHFLILSPLLEDAEVEYIVNEGQREVNLPLNLVFTPVDAMSNPSDTTIFVDLDILQYPLVIRKWREGDTFYPLGMNGQSKKVSKHLKDKKISLSDKEKIWLLCSNNQIVWIIGLRQDDRFKIKNQTQHILKIALL